MLECIYSAEEQCPVADGDHQMLRDPAKLLIDLVDIGLRAFIEKRVIDVVCIIDTFLLDLCAADVGTVVARAGNDGTGRAVCADHVDLLGARAFRDEDLTDDPGLGTVGGDRVACVAA